MKKYLTGLTAAACALSLSLTMAPEARADENTTLCNLYSNTAGGMAEFLLPLTVQQYVNMMSGKSPELVDQMTKSIMAQFSPDDLIALATIDPSKASIIGEAAGQDVIQIMMAGQGTSKAEIVSSMSSTCLSVGANMIVEEQKKMRDSIQAHSQTPTQTQP